MIQSFDFVGFVLWYLKCRCAVYKLCPIFGLVPTSVYIWLDFSLEVLANAVRCSSYTEFEIRWPSLTEMKASASILERNREYGKLMAGIFAVVDGARTPCADFTDADLQNAYWEGYTQSVEVTNLFVWNFSGEIIHAVINYPGSWHDSRVAASSGLYTPRLTELAPAGLVILGDSAFPKANGDLRGKIMRARKANEHDSEVVPQCSYLAAIDVLIERARP